MGDKSEVFCRQTLSVLAQNPKLMPEGLGLRVAHACAAPNHGRAIAAHGWDVAAHLPVALARRRADEGQAVRRARRPGALGTSGRSARSPQTG